MPIAAKQAPLLSTVTGAFSVALCGGCRRPREIVRVTRDASNLSAMQTETNHGRHEGSRRKNHLALRDPSCPLWFLLRFVCHYLEVCTARADILIVEARQQVCLPRGNSRLGVFSFSSSRAWFGTCPCARTRESLSGIHLPLLEVVAASLHCRTRFRHEPPRGSSCWPLRLSVHAGWNQFCRSLWTTSRARALG